MPVHPMTYVYLILGIADALCVLMSLWKRDRRACALALSLPLIWLGYWTNYTYALYGEY